MAHELPTELALILQNLYTLRSAPTAPPPSPNPEFALQTSKQGLGLRVLLDIDMGANGTLRVSWAEVTPPGGSTYYAGLRTITDLAGFSDWAQVPDVDLEFDNKRVLFDGARRTFVEIHDLYDLGNREVTVRFWLDRTAFSSAFTVAYLVTRAPFEWNELRFKLRAVGIQRKLPDRVGDIATVADLANLHDEDAGKVFPLPFGEAKRVRGIRAKVAVVGVLEGMIDDNDTTIGLADATDFPASGSVKIGDEIITYSGKSGNDLTGCTRGTGGTAAAFHFTGDEVTEQATEVHVFAGFATKAVQAVYGPNGGIITGGTVNLANTALISGKTLTTVSFASPPEEEIIEGATTFLDIGLATGSGGTFEDEDNAHREEAAFTDDNFARGIGGGTRTLRSQVPASAIADLGEIVKISLGVRHYGYGVNTGTMAVSVVSPSESLGSLAKGQVLDVQALAANASGNVNSSGSSNVQTDISHYHGQTIPAFANSTSPADTTDGDCSGWITATGNQCPGIVGPIFKRNAIEDGSIAVHASTGSAETLNLLYDLVGGIGDVTAKIKSVRLIVKHGHPLEGGGTFTCRIRINGSTVVTNTYNGSTSVTVEDSGAQPISGRTIGDLHNSNSGIQIAPSSAFFLIIWVAYIVIELEQGVFGNPVKAGGGSANVSGNANLGLTGQKKTWNVVEEFFPVSVLTDWTDLPSKVFQITGAPSSGSEVWIREVFLRIEYRARRRKKAEYLLADIDGALDSGHSQANGFYTGTSGALITNPVDVFEYIVVELFGYSTSRIDFTFNDTQRAAYDSDGHTIDGALVESMDALRFIRRYLLEARARFFLESDKVRFKRIPLVEAASVFTFDRSNIVVNESEGDSPILVEETTSDEVINSVAIYFARNLARSGDTLRPERSGSEITAPLVEEFDGVVQRADATSITAHKERRREFWLNFLSAANSGIAEDIGDLIVAKYGDTRKRLTFEATFESLKVAVDDVVAVNWPTLGLNNTLCRVTKEIFQAGDPQTQKAPRKRYQAIVLFDTEQT